MADNVTLNAMTGGDTVGADEVADGTLGTVKVQYVKLMDGTVNGTAKGVIDSTYGLKVDVARTVNVVLGAGSSVIGAVTISRGATISSTSASVTTSSGQILAADATRRSVILTNLGTQNVFVGASGVTDNEGIRLQAGQSCTIDTSPTAAIHAKSASGTQTVAIFTEST